MTISETEMQETIRLLLSQQRLAVLSTQRSGQPYSSLMAFAFTSDLKRLLVATGKSTRKHQNILQESRVSLLVDNRANNEADFHQAAALTILGKAEEIRDSERPVLSRLYLERHPYLEKFLDSPTTSFFQITVDHYLLVSRFQNVMEYRIGEKNDLFP